MTVYRSPSNAKKHPPRYCSLRCLGLGQRGASNPAYNGGRYIDPNGYVQRLAPEHPLADCRGYVYEHRLVVEAKIDRALGAREVVHHINHDKADNDPANLEVLASQGDHVRIHKAEGVLR